MLSSTLSRLFATGRAADGPAAGGAAGGAVGGAPSAPAQLSPGAGESGAAAERLPAPRQLPPMTTPSALGAPVPSFRPTGPLCETRGAADTAGPADLGRARRRPRRPTFDAPETPDVKALLEEADRAICQKSVVGRKGKSLPAAGAAPPLEGAAAEPRARPASSGSEAGAGPGKALGGSLTLNSLLDAGPSRSGPALPLEMSMPYSDVSQLRELLRTAKKRVAELEGQLSDLRAKTRLVGGSGIDDILQQTQGANGMSSRDVLRPMPPDEPASWQRDKEKLATKVRDLVLALHKERTERESTERAQKLEIMGLTRRLKYALLQTQGLHKKEKEQARYISDCEAAILKQQEKIRGLEARLRSGKGAAQQAASASGPRRPREDGGARAAALGPATPAAPAPAARPLARSAGRSATRPEARSEARSAARPGVRPAAGPTAGPVARPGEPPSGPGAPGPAGAGASSQSGSYSYYSSDGEDDGQAPQGVPGHAPGTAPGPKPGAPLGAPLGASPGGPAPLTPLMPRGVSGAAPGSAAPGSAALGSSGGESSGYSYSSSSGPSLRDAQLVGREDMVEGRADAGEIRRAAQALAAEAGGALGPLTVPQEDLTVEGL